MKTLIRFAVAGLLVAAMTLGVIGQLAVAHADDAYPGGGLPTSELNAYATGTVTQADIDACNAALSNIKAFMNAYVPNLAGAGAREWCIAKEYGQAVFPSINWSNIAGITIGWSTATAKAHTDIYIVVGHNLASDYYYDVVAHEDMHWWYDQSNWSDHHYQLTYVGCLNVAVYMQKRGWAGADCNDATYWWGRNFTGTTESVHEDWAEVGDYLLGFHPAKYDNVVGYRWQLWGQPDAAQVAYFQGYDPSPGVMPVPS